MKKVSILYIVGLLLSSIGLMAQKANYKVFPFKSGIVEYKQEGNAKGTVVKYIDQYGYKQADYSETEITVFGFTKKDKSATILLGSKVYAIDYQKNKVSVGANPVYDTYANSKDSDYDKLGRDAMASLGFSNTGKKGEILGKRCEIWKGSLGEIWVWKGLALKSVTNVLGVNITQVATKVKTNVSVSASKFEIPKGMKVEEIQTQQNMGEMGSMFGGSESGISEQDQQMMQDLQKGDVGKYMSEEEKAQIKKMAKMRYSDFKKLMKKEEPGISDKEINESYNYIQQMAKKL